VDISSTLVVESKTFIQLWDIDVGSTDNTPMLDQQAN